MSMPDIHHGTSHRPSHPVKCQTSRPVVAALVLTCALTAACSSSAARHSSGARSTGSATTAATHGGKAAAVTCRQLTAADVQPLVTAKVKGDTVTPVGTNGSGQQCNFAAGDDQGVDVIVTRADDPTFGYAAAKSHAVKPVPLSGIGDEGYREAGDFGPSAQHGGVMCTVSTASSVQFPGASTKLIVNGANHVTEAQDAVLAKALGTLCNRIFGTGSTTPDLSGL